MSRSIQVEDLDAMKYYELPNHSVRCLQPGDKVARQLGLVTVVDVLRNRSTGSKFVHFDLAPVIRVTDPMWDDVDVTIYRPRAGF